MCLERGKLFVERKQRIYINGIVEIIKWIPCYKHSRKIVDGMLIFLHPFTMYLQTKRNTEGIWNLVVVR